MNPGGLTALKQLALGLRELLIRQHTALVQTGQPLELATDLPRPLVGAAIGRSIARRQVDLVPQRTNLAPQVPLLHGSHTRDRTVEQNCGAVVVLVDQDLDPGRPGETGCLRADLFDDQPVAVILK